MNKKSLIGWLVAGMVGISIFCLLYRQALPTASIDIRVSRQEALKAAFNFINKEGFNTEGFDYAVRFYSYYHGSVYLQKSVGIEKSNELIKKGIPIWFWRVKLFKELKKDSFIVDVNPSTGEVVNFYHFILDTAKGDSLDKDTAYRIAVDKLKEKGIKLNEYSLMDSIKKVQKNRIDYTFVWEKKRFKINEATLRIKVGIQGSKLGSYVKYLDIPEEFLRRLEGDSYWGKVLYTASILSVFLLVVGAVFSFLLKPQAIDVKWKIPFFFGILIILLKIMSFLNNFPLMWSFYSNTVSKSLFTAMSFQKTLVDAFYTGFMIFSFGTLGGITSKFALKRGWTLLDSEQAFSRSSSVISTLVVGYSLGFMFLGYVTLFYLVGGRFFNIWMAPSTGYANFLSTVFPFLYPLTFSLSAALNEEFMFRLFAITFLLRVVKKRWLVILIPSLLWGVAHSTYPVFPVYVRAIELTIFGIIIGWVFVDYGIEAVIIAHYVMDALIVSLPLFNSKNYYFILSGVIVLLLVGLPLLLLLLRGKLSLSKKNRSSFELGRY